MHPPHLPALPQGMLKGLPWLSLAAVSSALPCLTKQAMISLGCTLRCSCTFPCPKTWLSLHQDHREQRSRPPRSDLLHRYRLPSLAFSGLD